MRITVNSYFLYLVQFHSSHGQQTHPKKKVGWMWGIGREKGEREEQEKKKMKSGKQPMMFAYTYLFPYDVLVRRSCKSQ